MIHSRLFEKNVLNDYSRGLPFKLEYMDSLDNCEFKDDDIFYYDRHDESIRLIGFDKFIDSAHWEHIRNTPTTKILINFYDDYFNIIDIKRFTKVIKEEHINPNQVYFLVMDDLFQKYAFEKFKDLDIEGINIAPYNVLLKRLKVDYTSYVQPAYRFSTLSRNYNFRRLSVLLYLVENDLINNFIYSFHNWRPYFNDKVIPLYQIREETVKQGYKLNDKISKWIDGLPYDIGNKYDKWVEGVNDVVSSSSIHLLIESHYDAYLDGNFQDANEIYSVEEFSPAFLTEKTWRTILCKKPFLNHSTPYALKGLKQLGYKTFSPFINEEYDDIEDNDLRLKTMMDEVKRICELDKTEFDTLVNNCKEICEYNYQLLLKHHDEVEFKDNFDFLNQYSKNYIQY